MKAFAWVPVGLLAGFLVGQGVAITADLLAPVAIACLVFGVFLLLNAGLVEG